MSTSLGQVKHVFPTSVDGCSDLDPPLGEALVGRTKARDIEGEGEGVGVLGTPLKRKSMEEEAFAGIELHGACG